MVCARCAAQRSWVRNSIHGPRNWCFCFHFSSQPCLILFPFFIWASEFKRIVAKLYRVSQLTQFADHSPRLAIGSGWFYAPRLSFSLFVNAFLLFPSLIFNLLRHGPYCCFRVAQGYGVTVLLSLRLPSFLPFFTLARLRSQSNLHIANHVKCLRMSN